nr:hypothetical protein [Tanacetum cinerariifolium]
MGIRIPQSNVPSSAADEAITKEMHNGLGRATTTASSLEAKRFVPMESKGQAREGSSKAGGSLKRSDDEELGQEQKVKEDIAQQEDVVAKQSEKESSKKARGRLKRKTSKAIEDKDKDRRSKIIQKTYTYGVCRRDVGYYEIHRADGSYKTYIFFSEMLNDFDREDLIMLYRLFDEKYASTRSRFNDLILWGDMKIMFKPDGDEEV